MNLTNSLEKATEKKLNKIYMKYIIDNQLIHEKTLKILAKATQYIAITLLINTILLIGKIIHDMF